MRGRKEGEKNSFFFFFLSEHCRRNLGKPDLTESSNVANVSYKQDVVRDVICN